jgi:NADPH:quinone reductase-like Zn-dependent oxidoreductase
MFDMKAARLQAYGDIDQFRYEDVPDPVAGAGEVLIKVEASGLNPVDLYLRQGYLAQAYPMDVPAILGVDAAGTIVALGTGVAGYAVGDRVIAHLPINGRGAHAELAVVPQAGLAKLPPQVSFAAGATLPLVALTGRQSMDSLGVKRGDRLLVSGALGAVGRSAVQYLKELGAVPVAGVRASRLVEGKAIAGEALDIEQEPESASFDLAVSTSGPVAGNAVKHVRDGGKLASAAQIPEGANADGRIAIENVLGHDDPRLLQAIADAAGRGELTIPIAATFPLAELAAAHRKLAEPGVGGKVIIAGRAAHA